MNYVGLDVGVSAKRKSSGVARLAFNKVFVGCATASLESRRKFFGMDEVDVAAIDAPMLGRESLDQRACERLFTLGCFQRRCNRVFHMYRVQGGPFGRLGRKVLTSSRSLLQDATFRQYFPASGQDGI